MAHESHPAARGNGNVEVEATEKLYVYPPEDFFETLPSDVVKRIMANFQSDTFKEMCMQKLTPFRDQTGGLFTLLTIHSKCHRLYFSPPDGEITMGDNVSAHMAAHIMRTHGEFILAVDFRGDCNSHLRTLVAKYCRNDRDPGEISRLNRSRAVSIVASNALNSYSNINLPKAPSPTVNQPSRPYSTPNQSFPAHLPHHPLGLAPVFGWPFRYFI